MLSCVQLLCNPTDCSLPDSPVHGIFQAIILEQVAISSSRGSSQPRDQACVSHLLHGHVGSSPAEPPGKPFPWRKKPHKGKQLGSSQSTRSPATHTPLLSQMLGPGLCSSEQKMVGGALAGPRKSWAMIATIPSFAGTPSHLRQRLGQGSELTGSPYTHCLYSDAA